MTEQQIKELQGLTSTHAKQLQEKFGKNELVAEKKESLFHKILGVICEPMFLLLIVSAVIYFILGEPKDGAIMLIFVVGIISIEAISRMENRQNPKCIKGFISSSYHSTKGWN